MKNTTNTTNLQAIIAVYSHPENGYAPAENLVKGTPYLVESVNMRGWSTDITLCGIEGEFNSVQFDYFVNGQQVNIHTAPYSHYKVA